MRKTYKVFLFENTPSEAKKITECLEGVPARPDDPCFKVEHHKNAHDAILAVRQMPLKYAPHLALLDMHQHNYVDAGEDICRELHERWPALPVIFLSRYSEFPYEKRGYRAGAINYISKKVLGEESCEEYLRDVLGKPLGIICRPRSDSLRYETGSLVVNLERDEASWRGKLLNVQGNDFLILAHLTKPENENNVISFDDLNKATGNAYSGTHTDINIRKRIQFIREKFTKVDQSFLSAWKERQHGILTETRNGYRWKPDQPGGAAASPSTHGN